MLQIREEAALRDAMETYLDGHWDEVASASPLELHATLRHYLSGEIAAARLTMTPDPPTRWQWWIANAFASVAPIVLGIVLSPIIAVIAIVLLVLVRLRESTDPEICPRDDPRHRAGLPPPKIATSAIPSAQSERLSLDSSVAPLDSLDFGSSTMRRSTCTRAAGWHAYGRFTSRDGSGSTKKGALPS